MVYLGDNNKNYYNDGNNVPLLKLLLAILFLLVIFAGITGCTTTRKLTVVDLTKPPKECDDVKLSSIKKLPAGKTTDAQIAVWLAKEGTVRTKEQATAKVCADYALRLYETMRDKKSDGSE